MLLKSLPQYRESTVRIECEKYPKSCLPHATEVIDIEKIN
jgi:hypothetical protein